MTQTTGRFFDELAKVMTNAAGAAQGLRNEAETVMRAQAERILREFEVVQREEFEAVKEMAAKARAENERLEGWIAELEAQLAKGGAAAPAARSTTARRTTPRTPRKPSTKSGKTT